MSTAFTTKSLQYLDNHRQTGLPERLHRLQCDGRHCGGWRSCERITEDGEAQRTDFVQPLLHAIAGCLKGRLVVT